MTICPGRAEHLKHVWNNHPVTHFTRIRLLQASQTLVKFLQQKLHTSLPWQQQQQSGFAMDIPHRKIITKTGGWIHHLQPFNWWCLTSLKLNMEPNDEPLKRDTSWKKNHHFLDPSVHLGCVCMLIPPCRKESDLYCHYWLRKFRVESWGGGVKNNQEHVGVSENGGTPKSSILIGISIINRPFWGPPIFGNTHV